MSTRNFETDEKAARYHSESRESVDEVLQRMCDATGVKPEVGGFARALDISPHTIRTWHRRGKVPLRFLQGFSKAHGVNLHWLSFGEGSPNSEAPPPEIDSMTDYGTPPEPTAVTTGGRAKVHRLASPARQPARPDEGWITVLSLVVDELNASNRRLPSKTLVALVDLLVELQQHGARLDAAVLRSQLRLIA